MSGSTKQYSPELLADVLRLNAEYARTIDDDRLEAWPDLFTDPCLYVVTSAENHKLGRQAGIIYADTQGMLRDRIVALRRANIYEPHIYQHIVGLSSIVDVDGDRVRAESPFLVVRIMRDGGMSIFVTGRYVDVIVRDGSICRFVERRVVCDSSRIDTLLAIPL